MVCDFGGVGSKIMLLNENLVGVSSCCWWDFAPDEVQHENATHPHQEHTNTPPLHMALLVGGWCLFGGWMVPSGSFYDKNTPNSHHARFVSVCGGMWLVCVWCVFATVW